MGLELFKPIKTLIDGDNPVIFTFYGDKYRKKGGRRLGIRPFVIFYDDVNGLYYFLKSRSSVELDDEGKIVKYRSIEENEVLIRKNPLNDKLKAKDDGKPNEVVLLYNDSYVDCSQIFVMDKDELESCLDLECFEYKNLPVLPKEEIDLILSELERNCFEVPPKFSILKVFINEKNGTDAESIYLHQKGVDELINLKTKEKEFDDSNEYRIKDFVSKKDDDENSVSHQRYLNGIDFCLKFLGKYFPDKKKEFLDNQELFIDDKGNIKNKVKKENERGR